jgi:hypothetical protein
VTWTVVEEAGDLRVTGPVLPDVGRFTFLRKNNLSQNETSALLLIP